jgi:uncharacterized coiled-coil protein SlyX
VESSEAWEGRVKAVVQHIDNKFGVLNERMNEQKEQNERLNERLNEQKQEMVKMQKGIDAILAHIQ